jgi:hypothetical protein
MPKARIKRIDVGHNECVIPNYKKRRTHNAKPKPKPKQPSKRPKQKPKSKQKSKRPKQTEL